MSDTPVRILLAKVGLAFVVATFAIGEAGAVNAALFAVALLAVNDAALAQKLVQFRSSQEAAVTAMRLPPVK
jgi:5-(carboxyamino)imidazole ribonucleotide mutase